MFREIQYNSQCSYKYNFQYLFNIYKYNLEIFAILVTYVLSWFGVFYFVVLKQMKSNGMLGGRGMSEEWKCFMKGYL